MNIRSFDKSKVLFWDIDTQFDFLKPKGNLYVPDSEGLIEKISCARKIVLESGYSIVASTDWHSMGNDEISTDPDWKTTWPPHCMAGEPGAARVGYLGELPVDYIEVGPLNAPLVRSICAREQFHLVIRTDTVKMFDNPNTHEVLRTIEPELNIVFGVALDVCVKNCVESLLKYKAGRIVLLCDVTKAIREDAGEMHIKAFERAGVELATLDQLAQELKCTC